MAFAITHKLSNGSATDAATYTTASVSVTAGDILWVVVTNASTVGTADAISGIVGTLGSTLTWHTVGSVLMNSSSRGRTTIAWAICPSTTSGTLTFQYGGVTQASGQWTVVTTTGSDTTTPVANFQTAQTAGVNPSITLSPAPAATSMVLAAMHANDTTSGTAGTGYALIGSGTTQATPAITHSTEQDTTTPSATVAFVKSGATNKAMIAVEIQGPQAVTLTAADSAHGHTSESPTLAQIHSLTAATSAHTHTSSSPTLTQVHQLTPASTLNTDTTSSPTLSTDSGLVAAGSSHTHTTSSPTLAQVHVLVPASTSNTHATVSPTLTQTHQLAAVGTINTHASTSPTLTQTHVLTAVAALNVHASGSPTLTLGVIVTPSERTSVAEADPRVSYAPAESRTSVAVAASRTSTSAAESRTSSN